MAAGPGKYDQHCTTVRLDTHADAVVLLVLNGDKGSGFSVQANEVMTPGALADLLQHIAKGLRALAAGDHAAEPIIPGTIQ